MLLQFDEEMTFDEIGSRSCRDFFIRSRAISSESTTVGGHVGLPLLTRTE